ncbi:uncharacterized protein LOC113334268 [Papaver somniferum]|uniref:uncharacterized protein LOC113334268 n=1 Tax=Papaver somniferum TaxID=3469 RepID=UPI000E6FC3B3|nr:uncharacterized protein LOC113334268 [Papaver somniferum]
MSKESSTTSTIISSSVSQTSSSLKLKTSYISFKLDETNYIQWRRQVLPILRSHDIYSHVDPTFASPSPFLPGSSDEEPLPNPKYLPWFQLQTLQRDNLSISAYLAKITSIRDYILTSSAPLSDVELVINTLRGLGPDYQAFSTAIETRSALPSFSELKPLLLNHEIRLTQYNQPTTNSTPSTSFYGSTFSSSYSSNFSPSRFSNNSSRGSNNSYKGGHGGNNGRGYRGGGCGRGGYFSYPTYSFGNPSPQQHQSILGAPPSQFSGSKQPCQI